MKKVITRDQVRKYNQMVEAAIDTDAYNMLAFPREYRDEDTKRWIGNPYGYLYMICDCFDDAEYYIKTVGDRMYIYMTLDGEAQDRCRIDDKEIARAFFGV